MFVMEHELFSVGVIVEAVLYGQCADGTALLYVVSNVG